MAETCDAPLSARDGSPVRCFRLGFEAIGCPYCTFWASRCYGRGHGDRVQALMDAHKITAHPERVPELVAQMAGDPDRLELLLGMVDLFPVEYRQLRRVLEGAGVVR